jgi:hypothetical protein
MAKAKVPKRTEHQPSNGRDDVKGARDAAYQAKVQRRVLRFFNEVRFAEQLMVAPHDRISIDEESHHTSDHMEHFEHLEPKRLFDRKTAQKIVVARDREFPFRGFNHVRDITAIFPGLVDILGGILTGFSAPNYGRWDLLYDIEAGGTEIEIEHAALLRTYKVIFLANGTNTLLWDPSDETTPLFNLLSGAATSLTANLLCGGHSFLSDGQLLTIGGGGFGPGAATSNQAWKFNPVTQTWTQTAAPMATQRWYPTALTLGDETGPTGASGRVLIAGGQAGGGPAMEVYSEATGTFSTVTQSGGTTKTFPQTYPGLSMLPGGEIFYTPTGFGNCGTGSVYALSDPSSYFTFAAPQGAVSGSWTNVSTGMNRTKGMSAILLQPSFPFVRVIVVGGGDSTTSATAQMINLSTLSPSWGPTTSIPDGRARVNVGVVLLPNGTVFVCGGTQTAPHTCYIYDPNTAVSAWKEMDELNAPRHYHSCALLLPSGKVMVAGGAAPGGCTASVENTIEVFNPPYLFNPDGTPAARPSIAMIDGVAPTTAVAPTVHHGATFVIETPEADDITRVVLVRPMAVTHQTDTEQRVIQCLFSQTGATQISAVTPNGIHPHAIAPRGYYMVFILNSNGTPSEGKFIHLH